LLKLLLEKKRRLRARNSAAEFANAITIPGKPVSEDEDEWIFHPIETSIAKHHLLLLNAAEDLIDGKLVHNGVEADGVMAFMPPGSAKSTYLDVVIPAYLMGKRPGYQVILTGYGSDILKKHGRRARSICASDGYKSIFGTCVKADNRAADEWSLENGSEYMAAGLLSGLTGNRGDLLIVDDPVKGRQEAESEATQMATWNAYSDDALTRLKPGGKQFLIQTRWNELDLAGHILPENWAGESGYIQGQDGRLWFVICLQAQCERDDDPLGREIGEYLWPEWFTAKHFEPFKRIPRAWRSLFQQTPTAEDGIYFKRDDFHWYVEPPKHLNVYITLDSAETPGGGDWTFIIVWGVSPSGNVYILNLWRGQVETDVWTEVLTGDQRSGGNNPGLIKHYKPLALVPEDDNIFKAVKPFLKKRMRKEQALCSIRSVPHGGKKKTIRAASFQGIAGMGLVHLPKNHELSEVLLDQLLRFPAGRYDDGVDACSAFGRHIDRIWEQAPIEDEPDTEVVPDALIIEKIWKPHTAKQHW